jgi:hypothetical protein
VLILQQPAHRATRYSIPRGGAAGPRRNLAWPDAVRSFRGHANELPGTRKFNGVIVHGRLLTSEGTLGARPEKRATGRGGAHGNASAVA